MSVLIFIDVAEGHVKKASLEVLTYGAKLAGQLNTSAEAVVLGPVTEDLAALGKYGVKKIIALSPNAYKVEANEGIAEVVPFNTTIPSPKVKVTAINKLSGEVPLTEAEIVVSAGRGMKGPENWGIIEDLAHALHAALACSRPVADAHWRPHNEHVGQTGIAIAPNLYIAIGISGAIQHLAGVNRSKVIVVINKDPEAPFFKAADYGIVGDAFEVVPKIIDAVKKLKGVA